MSACFALIYGESCGILAADDVKMAVYNATGIPDNRAHAVSNATDLVKVYVKYGMGDF